MEHERCCMKKWILVLAFISVVHHSYCWGFYAHRQVNYYAVFLLPPGMLGLYKKEIGFLTDHAVDPDRRRYIVPAEGPRHFIDLDHYGTFPFDSLPRKWKEAVARYGEDSLNQHGIVPWWIEKMMGRLTLAFQQGDRNLILKTSADLGHYIGDLHVPLHASSNHNGQLTGQHGIHGFWESRIPEIFAATHFDFLIGQASYIRDIPRFLWQRVLESAAAADTVLRVEKQLSLAVPPQTRYAFETRNGILVRQYAAGYAGAYHAALNGMVERRMRQSIQAIASCWYTAWVNAGQPDLNKLAWKAADPQDQRSWDSLQKAWMLGRLRGRSCEE